jgi:hypothetical protein
MIFDGPPPTGGSIEAWSRFLEPAAAAYAGTGQPQTLQSKPSLSLRSTHVEEACLDPSTISHRPAAAC